MSPLPSLTLNLILLLVIPFATSAADRANGTDPLETSLISDPYLNDVKEQDLGRLSLSEPKLRLAYFTLMRSASAHPRITDEPQALEVLKDVRKRGDSATPLWLDMMEKNHGSWLEYTIPHIIASIGNIKMEPYVNHLREMVRTRSSEISGSACESALWVFFQHGTAEDVEMVQKAAKDRPFLAPYVQSAFEKEKRRLTVRSPEDSEPATPPALPQTAEQPAPLRVPEVRPAPSVVVVEPATSTSWLAATALAGVAALGVVWYLIRRRS